MKNHKPSEVKVFLKGEDITERCEISEKGKSLSILISPKVKLLKRSCVFEISPSIESDK